MQASKRRCRCTGVPLLSQRRKKVQASKRRRRCGLGLRSCLTNLRFLDTEQLHQVFLAQLRGRLLQSLEALLRCFDFFAFISFFTQQARPIGLESSESVPQAGRSVSVHGSCKERGKRLLSKVSRSRSPNARPQCFAHTHTHAHTSQSKADAFQKALQGQDCEPGCATTWPPWQRPG